MKGLTTLIKLHKRTLDELRRQMVSLENQKAQLLQLSAKLKEELSAEIKMASRNPEMGQFFGDFSKRMQLRQEDIGMEVASLDKQMAKLNAEIFEAFSELKKYEVALEQAKQREKAEADRRETIAMDDIAQQQFRRTRKED